MTLVMGKVMFAYGPLWFVILVFIIFAFSN